MAGCIELLIASRMHTNDPFETAEDIFFADPHFLKVDITDRGDLMGEFLGPFYSKTEKKAMG